MGESTNFFFRSSNIRRMTTGDPGNANGREVELSVRWERSFSTWDVLYMLGLFAFGENVFGGTLGQVGTALFNLHLFNFDVWFQASQDILKVFS